MKIKVNKGIIYGICLVGGVGVCVNTLKKEEAVLEENKVLMQDIDRVNYNLENLYDNIEKINKLQSLQAERADSGSTQVSLNKSSLLEDDFKRCKFDVLGYWVETYKKDKLYYENEPETTEEESTFNYYMESDGAIEEIQLEESNSGAFTILEGAESIPSEEMSSIENGESETEVVEEPDLEKTFIIISISKYYNGSTTNNIKYEIFNGTESLGDTDTNIVLKNLKLDSGYSNSRIDLIELDGNYDISQLTYQVSLRNGENTISLDGLKEIAITEDKVSDDYILETIDNKPIVFIKKEPIIGSNRIEIIENIRESIVEESTEESSDNIESSESIDNRNSGSGVARGSTNRGPGESAAESSAIETTQAEVVRRPKIVKVKETDELFKLSYNFECWGPSDVIKKINGSVITVVDNQNIESVLDCIDNIQCKFNDSKFNIDESNKFIEFDFAVNIQILRSKLNNYLSANEQPEISSNTINTFKNGFDKRFSLKVSNDNVNILLKLQK